jgi:alpha,alpha-trehalase
MSSDPVLAYIEANIDRSIYRDEGGSGFKGIDLPFPYTSPCIQGEGKFTFFFYWDTHFTNIGLLKLGKVDTARDNIRNMLWLIDRYGFMPNHVGLENRSQPPYLTRMVQDYFDHVGGPDVDPDFFQACALGLRKEAQFWRTARCTPLGLSRYGHQASAAGCRRFFDFLLKRLPLSPDLPEAEKIRIGGHHLAVAESGCDFTNRFEDGRGLDYCPVDLNALLFEQEEWLATASELLGWREDDLWTERATFRKNRMNELLWDKEQGLFFDYDFVNKQRSPVPAQSGYVSLATGLATAEQAKGMVENLPLFEREYGVAFTPDVPGCRNFQWAYPTVWPPMVSALLSGLERAGFTEEAARVANTFVRTTRKLFNETGQLWEKTDAETGKVAGGEYDAAAMIGWTAGVYLQAVKVLWMMHHA